MNVAAVITQVLPNGNLVIRPSGGAGQFRDARGRRGRHRPARGHHAAEHDGHEKIAELRVAYGGRGQITDVQQPRYGAQVLDILLPY